MARLEPKTSTEVRFYTFDWSQFLGDDAIATSTVTVTGATLDSDSHDGTFVTVYISGGSDGTVARVSNTITTIAGATETETHTLVIGQSEPVSLSEAKAHLRVIDDTTEDALIESLIVAAREYVENETGQVLKRRVVTEHFDRFTGYLELTKRPIVSVASVNYTDTSGDAQVYADFITTDGRYPLRVYPGYNSWFPSTRTSTGITVSYTAGYADGEVPQALIQAMLLLIGHWYAARETASERPLTEAPFAVNALLQQYRTVRL